MCVRQALAHAVEADRDREAMRRMLYTQSDQELELPSSDWADPGSRADSAMNERMEVRSFSSQPALDHVLIACTQPLLTSRSLWFAGAVLGTHTDGSKRGCRWQRQRLQRRR